MDAADPLDDETRAGAVDVLSDLTVWRLAPHRWERVQQSIDVLHDALAAHDEEAVRRAVADLELSGPVRATRIGATPLVPAPEPVRERANQLVHTLTSSQPQDGPDSGSARGATPAD